MRHLAAVLGALALLLPLQARGAKKPLAGKKVLMVIAFENFRDEEYKYPRQALEGAGAKIVVASTRVGRAKGMLGMRATVNALLSKVRAQDFDAVVFVGGVGASKLWNNPYALKLAKEAAKKGKVVAAICIAPVILANAGVLRGKKATVWPSRQTIGILKAKGATYVKRPVVVDGKVITAEGPHAARAFAQAILHALAKKAKK